MCLPTSLTSADGFMKFIRVLQGVISLKKSETEVENKVPYTYHNMYKGEVYLSTGVENCRHIQLYILIARAISKSLLKKKKEKIL